MPTTLRSVTIVIDGALKKRQPTCCSQRRELKELQLHLYQPTNSGSNSLLQRLLTLTVQTLSCPFPLCWGSSAVGAGPLLLSLPKHRWVSEERGNMVAGCLHQKKQHDQRKQGTHTRHTRCRQDSSRADMMSCMSCSRKEAAATTRPRDHAREITSPCRGQLQNKCCYRAC